MLAVCCDGVVEGVFRASCACARCCYTWISCSRHVSTPTDICTRALFKIRCSRALVCDAHWPCAGTVRRQDKIAALKEQMRSLKEIEVQLNAAPDGRVSLTDPDARSMKTRGTGVVGYNVQTAVDAKHHLIVAHVVTHSRPATDESRWKCTVATLRMRPLHFTGGSSC